MTVNHNHHVEERQPLLRNSSQNDDEQASRDPIILRFEPEDPDNPRAWSHRMKMTNVFLIALMAILSPLASSMFTPGIDEIAAGLNTSVESVIACTTGHVVFMGIGPLIWAPFSETFGRRVLYMSCFSIFTLLQIPSALAPNIETLIVMRTLSGFFGSVGVANGGGSLSDMFEPSQRAGVFGWYLLGPLLGPCIGPLLGGVIVQYLNWRWIFWVLTFVAAANTLAGFFFLRESYAPVLLLRRQQRKEAEEAESDDNAPSRDYTIDGLDRQPLHIKLRRSLTRPLRILAQPIVLTMSTYQALLFATSYSIFTNMQRIYGGEYGFNNTQVGLAYLGPGAGFLTAVWFLVPRIDTVYNYLAKRNGGKGLPEYRLPLANVGAVCLPLGLFWFAWTVQAHTPWYVSLISTYFYGIGQVSILNCTTNYYIDCFEKYAASAIAAGALFRGLVGGIIPLFVPSLIDQIGYGWGISLFGFLSLAMAPAPLLLFRYGGAIRERFQITL